MSRKSLAELSKLVKMELEYHKGNVESFQGNENPQIKEMLIESEGQIRALETVLHYCKTGGKEYFSRI